jgi:hypothetical protein
LHIYTGSAALNRQGVVPMCSGAIDYVALSAHGFADTRERCRAFGVPFRERSVPGFPIWQLFIYDPNGIQFELNFHAAAEERPDVAIDPENFLEAVGMVQP